MLRCDTCFVEDGCFSARAQNRPAPKQASCGTGRCYAPAGLGRACVSGATRRQHNLPQCQVFGGYMMRAAAGELTPLAG